jgi:DNA-binding IclR family transcriptional regulator
MSPKEIAEITGLNAATVRTECARGVEREYLVRLPDGRYALAHRG